jgi:hypothetical protein
VEDACAMCYKPWKLCSVLEVLECMHCVLLCMLEAAEGVCCMLEIVEAVLDLLEVLEITRCMLLCMLEVVEGAGAAGSDALRATLYARGHGGRRLCTDALCARASILKRPAMRALCTVARGTGFDNQQTCTCRVYHSLSTQPYGMHYWRNMSLLHASLLFLACFLTISFAISEKATVS